MSVNLGKALSNGQDCSDWVRCAFAPVQSGCEVGQRPSPGYRLGHRLRSVLPAAELQEERLVCAAHNPPCQLCAAVGEQRQLALTSGRFRRHCGLSLLDGSEWEFTIITEAAWPSTNCTADTDPRLVMMRWNDPAVGPVRVPPQL